jgi:putative aldouronate transport system permease protein
MEVCMEKSLKKQVGKNKVFYLLFLPIAIYLILFSYYPFFTGLALSFQENKLIGKKGFVGFENYVSVLKDPNFIVAIKNSLVIGLWDFFLYFVLSLVFALMLNEVRLKKVRQGIQTLAYVPYLFSWAVIGGIWALLFDVRGVVNHCLGWFGISPVFFLASPQFARPLIIGMGIWRSVGYYALLYMVAITSIDSEIFEAARIDGAGRFSQIVHVILPQLVPTMKTIIVLLAMGILTHFDEIYVMVNPANRNQISSLLLYVYETGILSFKSGTASAGATLVMIGTLVVTQVFRSATKFDT